MKTKTKRKLYVGLTDNPGRRRKEHGNPLVWQVTQMPSEKYARAWEKMMLDRAGYTGGTGGKGWKYGYIYAVTKNTVE